LGPTGAGDVAVREERDRPASLFNQITYRLTMLNSCNVVTGCSCSAT